MVSPRIRVKIIPEPRVLGLAYEDAYIEIDPRQDSAEFLDTLIHEMLHCFLPNLEEQYIKKVATKIKNAIWAKKYRRLHL